ncbi:hypothetical protein M514_01837 [Trichuris suis]|uniref:phospholipase A2 n=1 Tax=Trichuris suis TaxID=68888 RepID=A0A085NTB6_9BILA|nr:hypothetical protein M514_01837 [Trichuris suis]
MEKSVDPVRRTQYMQPISNFIGNVVNVAKEKVMGETWWLPSSTREIVEIPPKALKALQEVDRKDIFGIRRGNDEKTSDETFHITMDWKNGKHTLSLCRCSNWEDAYDHFNNLIYFLPLFSFIESRKRLDSLLHCIRRHSLWKPVHIAAMLGIRKYFENLERQESCKISEQLNQICQPEGRYPLHIAVENCHVDLALYMINVLKVPISLSDLNGQNVFHYAAGASPAVVTALAECEDADKQINVLSKDGYTPLFMSIISCKPTCTTALIKKGAVWDILCNGRSAVHQAMLQDGSKVKDIIKTLVEASPDMIRDAEPQTGNSALHIAGNKQALLSLFLVCSNLDLELRNKAGQTALHMQVRRGNLGCALVLLYNGANPDAQDSNGNTSLHLAVSALNVDIAKALLVLGANPNILNHTGDSPRHLAARLGASGRELLSCLTVGGAERCNANHRGCVAGCSYRNSVENEVTSDSTVRDYSDVLNDFKHEQNIRRVIAEAKSGKKLKFLLSLDGGGIRGLILVQMLLFIESLLEKPLISYVDWLAGTSTGAFVAAGIAKGKTLRECQMVYLRMKDLLFEDHKRPYDSDAMERHIKEHIGLETRMTDISKPKMIITSVLAQKHPVKLHIFRSYTLPGEDRIPCHDPDSNEEMPLWKVLRCTSAAPTYFTSVDNKFVDGGLIANNPSVDLLSEIQLYKMALEYTKSTEELEIGCLLNIGTGRIPDMPIESLNVGIASPIGMVGVLKNLGYMIMDQVTATEGRPVDRAKAWCNEMGIPFFRFSPQMTKDYLLDTKTDREVTWLCAAQRCLLAVAKLFVQLYLLCLSKRACIGDKCSKYVFPWGMSAFQYELFVQVQVLYDFDAQPDSGELSVSAGEYLSVTRQNVGDGWWEGINSRGEHGLFPQAYVQVFVVTFTERDERVALYSVLIVSSSPPPVPPPPLPTGYSDASQSIAVPTARKLSAVGLSSSTNGNSSAPPRTAAGGGGGGSYLNSQFDEFDDDWSDDSQSQGNGSKTHESSSHEQLGVTRRSVSSLTSAEIDPHQEGSASDSSSKARRKHLKNEVRSVSARWVSSCCLLSPCVYVFACCPLVDIDPGAYDDDHHQPSRSVDSGLNRVDRSKKSITRFNKFVKSGTENFVLNTTKTSQPVSEKFEICVIMVASPQKASKLKGLKSFMTYQLMPSFSGIQVCRRYKHFDWLHEQLIAKFAVMLIPPLPEKQVAGRYEEEFVEHRMHLLQLWVTKICRHPVLSQCEAWMHFLTCTDEKKWKQGKRKAEKDEYKDGNFFFTICCPNRHLDNSQTESNIESFARMGRTMESALRSFHAIVQEQAKHMVNSHKRECQKYGAAFHALGLSFELDQNDQCRPLANALKMTADCYDKISHMYEMQPKKYLEPLMDNFFIYKGMLSLIGDTVQVHKSANAKVREHQKLVEDGKATLADADLVRSRAEVVDYTILAEFNHFRNECVFDFNKMIGQFLLSQITFYQGIVDKLKEAYAHFE